MKNVGWVLIGAVSLAVVVGLTMASALAPDRRRVQRCLYPDGSCVALELMTDEDWVFGWWLEDADGHVVHKSNAARAPMPRDAALLEAASFRRHLLSTEGLLEKK